MNCPTKHMKTEALPDTPYSNTRIYAKNHKFIKVILSSKGHISWVPVEYPLREHKHQIQWSPLISLFQFVAGNYIPYNKNRTSYWKGIPVTRLVITISWIWANNSQNAQHKKMLQVVVINASLLFPWSNIWTWTSHITLETKIND